MPKSTMTYLGKMDNAERSYPKAFPWTWRSLLPFLELGASVRGQLTLWLVREPWLPEFYGMTPGPAVRGQAE